MFKSRLVRLSAAGIAAVAGVVLVVASVGAHSGSVSTRLANTSVINSVAKLATAAGVGANQDADELENEAQEEAAELAAEQQKEAAEAAAEAAEEAAEAQQEAAEDAAEAQDEDNDDQAEAAEQDNDNETESD